MLADKLQRVTARLWRDFLGDGELVFGEARAERLAVTVSIALNRNGSGYCVVLRAGEALGKKIAMRVLAQRAVADELADDVLLELVNMLAGGLKALLADGYALSLPRVVRAEGPESPGGRVIERLACEWRGEAFELSVRLVDGGPSGEERPQRWA